MHYILAWINRLPLLSTGFELLGFAVSAWFVYRCYLLFDRQQQFWCMQMNVCGQPQVNNTPITTPLS